MSIHSSCVADAPKNQILPGPGGQAGLSKFRDAVCQVQALPPSPSPESELASAAAAEPRPS